MIAEKRKVIKWTDVQQDDLSGKIYLEEWVAREVNLKIVVNSRELVRFACSPVDCDDLAVGFLFTEGVISSIEDIDHVILNRDDYRIELILSEANSKLLNNWNKERTLSSGCAQGVISNMATRRRNLVPVKMEVSHSVSSISKLFYHLKNNSSWYDKTGCIHQVTLFNNDGTAIIREDIGRHNAVDKVIGAALQCKVNFDDTIMMCTGRLSSDMMLKAAKARIPIVVSRTAPTSLAIDIADDSGITLIGFARGKRLNVYTHAERIEFNEKQKEIYMSDFSEEDLSKQ